MHVWKCRLCCSPATWVCFGRTHYCAPCHTRLSAAPAEAPPPVACPGRPACAQPLPAGQSTHHNGPDPACEQLYACGACSSGGRGSGRGGDGAAAAGAPATSRNLLLNPSAAAGTTGWLDLYSVGHVWSTERSEVRLSPAVRHNFVSTFAPCVMAQVVDLSRAVRRPDEAAIAVSAAFRARTDCPSWYTLEAAVYDAALGELEYRTTGKVAAPADCWEPARHVVGPAPAARYVLICLRGSDGRCWAGRYGSKATDCAVRVLLGGAPRRTSWPTCPRAAAAAAAATASAFSACRPWVRASAWWPRLKTSAGCGRGASSWMPTAAWGGGARRGGGVGGGRCAETAKAHRG
eukprot:TRINITY_DN17784_c0_g1_i1.p2 TRINITY_DN17784_c0_g1~~TRINITY_DN17784_c0_g1_i1.p2  ORF type:complete len:348 (+),score=55.12 TRINITY_DN17784_c0_g1_i1:800-1843(+)